MKKVFAFRKSLFLTLTVLTLTLTMREAYAMQAWPQYSCRVRWEYSLCMNEVIEVDIMRILAFRPSAFEPAAEKCSDLPYVLAIASSNGEKQSAIESNSVDQTISCSTKGFIPLHLAQSRFR